MAAPKLKPAQRLILLKLIAADFSNEVIYHKLSHLNAEGERRKAPNDGESEAEPFPLIGLTALSYYRNKYKEDIEAERTKRRDSALSSGLALKAERVARLIEHADRIETMLYHHDKHGRMWNCREYRQTLEDIALEMGHRRPKPEEGEEQIIKVYIGIDPEKI